MASESSSPESSSSLRWLLEIDANPSPVDFSLAWANSRSLLEECPFNVLIKDTDGRRVYCNKAYREYRQQPLSEILGKTDFDLFPTEIAKQRTDDDQRVLQTGKSSRAIEKQIDGNHADYWIERIKIPLRGLEDSIVGVVVIFWDVTEFNETQEALAQERSLMHALMDNIPDAIYFKDRDSRFLRISSAMAEKFNMESPEDAFGLTDADIFTAEHAQQALDDEARIIATGEPMVSRLEKETWKDREDTWVSTTKMPLRDPGGEIVGTFGISRDVTELKKTQDQLQEARDEADAASRAKSDFLANMSHEIRTPMNAIIGMTELLLDTSLTPTQREYLSIVQESGESLLSLLNDILDFSKIEAGHMELDAAPFDLHQSIGNTLRSLAMRAHGKGLELAYDLDPEIPETLIGDIGRLRQIVINLVGNAIKFTKVGEVVLRGTLLERDQNEVVLQFSVTDTGVGIRKEKQQQIFDEFQQADTSTTRDFGGTGLGLAISSRLVALMNGEIAVESEPGEGSTFTFTAKFRVDESEQSQHVEPETDLAGTRVLIVDDNQTNRRILHDMLTNWGMKPTDASSAVEARDILLVAAKSGEPFQAAILDVNMPGQSGFDLAVWIRDDEQLESLPLLMLTSASRPGDAKRRQQLGIAAHLLKPAKQSEVFEELVTALGPDSSKRASLTQQESARSRSFSGAKILLAEDNLVNQKLAVGVLKKLDCKPVLVTNGREAIEALQSRDFDLILMDVQMPELDGLQATRKIRELEQDEAHIPIVAMTAHAMAGDRDKCLEAGMDDYLSKPVRVKELTTMLTKYLTDDEAGSIAKSESDESSQLIDWKEALEGVDGDRDLLRVVIDAFLEEYEMHFHQVSEAISKEDSEQLSRLAHTIKGALLTVAAHPVAAVARQLEDAAHAKNFKRASELAGTLQQRTEAMIPALKNGPE